MGAITSGQLLIIGMFITFLVSITKYNTDVDSLRSQEPERLSCSFLNMNCYLNSDCCSQLCYKLHWFRGVCKDPAKLTPEEKDRQYRQVDHAGDKLPGNDCIQHGYMCTKNDDCCLKKCVSIPGHPYSVCTKL